MSPSCLNDDKHRCESDPADVQLSVAHQHCLPRKILGGSSYLRDTPKQKLAANHRYQPIVDYTPSDDPRSTSHDHQLPFRTITWALPNHLPKVIDVDMILWVTSIKYNPTMSQLAYIRWLMTVHIELAWSSTNHCQPLSTSIRRYQTLSTKLIQDPYS